MRVRFKNWRFRPGEPAIMHSAVGPIRDSERGKLWYRYSFRSLTRNVERSKYLSIGFIPATCFGQRYVDGTPSKRDYEGVRKKPKLVGDFYNCRRLRDILPPRLLEYPLSEEQLNENCFLIECENVVLIVPMLEAVRAYLVATRFLAHGLLEQNFLEDLVVKHEENGDELYLEFPESVPLRVLTRNAVRHIARIITIPSLRRMWNEVLINYLKTPGSGPHEFHIPAPLKTTLLPLQSSAYVRGIPFGEYFYVLRLIRADAQEQFRFRHIVFKVQGSVKKTINAPERFGVSRHRKKKVKTDLIITGASSRNHSSIHNYCVSETAMKNGANATVERIYDKEETINEGHTPLMVPATVEDRRPEYTPLGDKSASGAPREGETNIAPPAKFAADPSKGLVEFYNALNQIVVDKFDVIVGEPEVYQLPEALTFANLPGERILCYAVSMLSFPHERRRCGILEIAPRTDNDHRLYTIYFASRDSSQGKHEKRISLLIECLRPGGSWELEKISKLREAERCLIRFGEHVPEDINAPEHWAARLYKNAKKYAL